MRRKVFVLVLVGFIIEAYSQLNNCNQRLFPSSNCKNTALLQNTQASVGAGNCGQFPGNQDVFEPKRIYLDDYNANQNGNCFPGFKQETFRQSTGNFGSNSLNFAQQEIISNQNSRNENCDCAPDFSKSINTRQFEQFPRNLGTNQVNCKPLLPKLAEAIKPEVCNCFPSPNVPCLGNQGQIPSNSGPIQEYFGQRGANNVLPNKPECNGNILNVGPVFSDNFINTPNNYGFLGSNQNQCGCSNQNNVQRAFTEPCSLKQIDSQNCGTNQPFSENSRLQSNSFQDIFDRLAKNINQKKTCDSGFSNTVPTLASKSCEKENIIQSPFPSINCGNSRTQTQTTLSPGSCERSQSQFSSFGDNSCLQSKPALSVSSYPSDTQGVSLSFRGKSLPSQYSPESCGNGPIQIQPSLSSLPSFSSCQNNDLNSFSSGSTGIFGQLLGSVGNNECFESDSRPFRPIPGPIISENIFNRPTAPCRSQVNLPDVTIEPVRPFPIFERPFNNAARSSVPCDYNGPQNVPIQSGSIEFVRGPCGPTSLPITDNVLTSSKTSFDGSLNSLPFLINNNNILKDSNIGLRGCNSPNFPFSSLGTFESSPGSFISGPFASGLALSESFVSPLQYQPLFTPPALQSTSPGVTTAVVTPPSSIPTQIIQTTVVDNSVANSLANALNLLIMSDLIQSQNPYETRNGVDLVSGLEVNPTSISLPNFYEGVTEVVTPLSIPPTEPQNPIIAEIPNITPASNPYPELLLNQIIPPEVNFFNPLTSFPNTNSLPFPGSYEALPPYISVPPEAVTYAPFNPSNEFSFNPYGVAPTPYPEPISPQFPPYFNPFPSPYAYPLPEMNPYAYPYFNVPDYTSEFPIPAAPLTPSLPFMEMSFPALNMEIPDIYGGISLPFSSSGFLNGAIEIVNSSPVATEILLPAEIPAQLRCSLGFTPSSLPVVSVDVIEPLDSSFGFY